MVRTPTIDKNGIRRGAWSEEEDNTLKAFVLKHGHSNWRQLPRFAGLARCGKSCRLRWNNYLKPDLKRGNYTQEEVEQIIKLREEHGNKWSLIASKLPGRTDNEIKNYWHTHLKKHAIQSPQSIVSTQEYSKNLDEMKAIEDSMEQVSISMSTSQSVQLNGIESTTADSIPEVSSIGILDSIDSGIWKEPFSYNDVITTQSTCYDQSILIKEFDSTTGAGSFPEVSSTDSFHQAFEGIWHEEPVLFSTSNNQITQSNGCDSAQTFGTGPFLLDTSYSQSLAYNSALSGESVAGTFECTIGSQQYLPPYESDCCSWTQPLSTDASSADHAMFSTTASNEECCRAPFMPLETSDDDLVSLLSVVHSFMNSDEDQNNATLF